MSVWVCVSVSVSAAVIQVIRFDLPNTLSLNVVLWQFIFYFSFHLRIFAVLLYCASLSRSRFLYLTGPVPVPVAVK